MLHRSSVPSGEDDLTVATCGAQQLQHQVLKAADPEYKPRKPAGRWGLTQEGRNRAAQDALEPMQDPNDELCRICLQGVSVHF
jgi:hypothetical protein